jgi:hypothetical protein
MKLTKEQQRALKNVYQRDPDIVPPTYLQFRRTVRPAFGGECVMVQWANMWLGIERDGYTHS